MELVAEFEPGTASEVGLKVRVGQDEETVIGYDATAHEVFVDRRRSGVVDFDVAFPGKHTGPLCPADGRVRLHVFLDWSCVEVARLVSLDVWEMESAWTTNGPECDV